MSYNKSHEKKHEDLESRLKRLERLVLLAIITNLPQLAKIFLG